MRRPAIVWVVGFGLTFCVRGVVLRCWVLYVPKMPGVWLYGRSGVPGAGHSVLLDPGRSVLAAWLCAARMEGRVVTQLDLFDLPKRTTPPAVPVRTSIAAAQAIAEMAPTLRGKVYAFIAKANAGATRQEIADGLQMKLQSVCGRVGELKGMSLVWEGQETRDGRRVIRVSLG